MKVYCGFALVDFFPQWSPPPGYSDPYVVIAVAGEEKKNFKKTATIKKTVPTPC